MSRVTKLVAGRRKYLIGFLPLLAVIGGFAVWHSLSPRKPATTADLSFQGPMSGRLSDLSDSSGHHNGCRVTQVYGKDEWVLMLTGALNGKRVEFLVALYPYSGAGTYTDVSAETMARTPLSEFTQLKLPVHMQISSWPTEAPDAIVYATEPGPGHALKSLEEGATLGSRGRASVTLDADERSGRLDAVLMRANNPAAESVPVSGTFRCGPLEREQPTTPTPSVRA